MKGLFFIVPHEEHGIYISPFDDDMIIEPYYLHFQQHPFLYYDDTHLHGCTYGIHLSHLENHGFLCSFPSLFDVGGTSSHTWVKRYRDILLKKIIIGRKILYYFMIIYIFMGILMRLL